MTTKPRILVVDDEDSPRESLRFILKDIYDVHTEASGESGLKALYNNGPFDVVLLDIMMPGLSGLEVLAKVRETFPTLPVIIITAITEAKTAVQAMKAGASDYLNKPFDANEIRLVVARLLKEKNKEIPAPELRPESQGPCRFDNIIGSSSAMGKVYSLVERLLNAEATVLVLGETGTGKELIARALHFNSGRKEQPFIPVHCAAIPSELLESELFGHEKGSFTGALQRRIGMFEAATGGTLFLDEIGEMPLATQGKLLRAIQEREIRRVGGHETISINVRMIAATNRNLEQEVKKGTFREDLFYRINVVPICLPSLRERKEDVPVLISHFSHRLSKELNRPIPEFTPEAMGVLVNYAWPGNVRELEHAVERLMVTCDATVIDVEKLPFIITQGDSAAIASTSHYRGSIDRSNLGEVLELESGEMDLTKITDAIERKAIESALQRTGGVITEAARSLNITRRMLRYKMDKFGIASKHQVIEEQTSNLEEPPFQVTDQN